MAEHERNNVQRTAGLEMAKVNVAWRPNGVGSALQAFAAGDTVRSLTRTGVGAWLVVFREGVMIAPHSNGTIAKRDAHVSVATAQAHVGAFSILNGELNVVVQTRDYAGAAVEIAAETNTWISLEIIAEVMGSAVPPDTV